MFKTPAGPQPFQIAGTFYDYTRDQGVVYMSSEKFLPLWKDDRVHSLAIYLHPNGSAEEVANDFRREFSGGGQFILWSNRELRTRIFEIFDQTFAVTYVLRTIAVIVAVVGICLTLTTLITERARELGVLRAIGASVRQLRRLLLWESAMIGLLAAVVGLASGLCLSVVLTGVINRAFFGWTVQLAFPWGSLAVTPFGSSRRRFWRACSRRGARGGWWWRRRCARNETDHRSAAPGARLRGQRARRRVAHRGGRVAIRVPARSSPAPRVQDRVVVLYRQSDGPARTAVRLPADVFSPGHPASG
jgi:hypothetical protein